MRPSLILTGFMGTGKSTVGALVAKRLGRRFLDTDALVVERAGRPIPEIFAEEGEAAFREYELAVARDVGARWNLVVATGGGLLMNPLCVEALRERGRIICLSADVETILQRVRGGTRPLLQSEEPEAVVLNLLNARAEVYGQFPQIRTDGRVPMVVVDEVVSLFKMMGGCG